MKRTSFSGLDGIFNRLPEPESATYRRALNAGDRKTLTFARYSAAPCAEIHRDFEHQSQTRRLRVFEPAIDIRQKREMGTAIALL